MRQGIERQKWILVRFLVATLVIPSLIAIVLVNGQSARAADAQPATSVTGPRHIDQKPWIVSGHVPSTPISRNRALSVVHNVAVSSSGWTTATSYDWTWLNGVSCPDATDCTAVGGYGPAPGVGGPTVVSFTNNSVSPVSYFQPSSSFFGSFNSISCAAVGTCIAVGYAYPTANFQPAVAEEVDGVWGSVQPLAMPTGVGNAVFTGVSCPDAGTCVAVGVDEYASGATVPMYDTVANGVWGVVTELSTPTGYGYIYGISCANAADCAAVGVDETGCPTLAGCKINAPIVISMSNGTWSAASELSSPNPAGTELNSVSCSDATDCTAIGQEDAGNGYSNAITVTDNHGVWEPVTVLAPQAGPMNGISCESQGNCTAVGWDNAGGHPMYSNEAAGVWGPTIDVPTQGTAFFYGVGCANAQTTVTCVAVGEAEDGSLVGGPLIPSEALSANSSATRSPANAASSGTQGAVLLSETYSRLPSAPTGIAIAPATRKLSVSWQVPRLPGSSPIRSYTVTATSGSLSARCTTTQLRCTLSGLSESQPYTVQVRATNDVGEGVAGLAPNLAYPVTASKLSERVIPIVVQVKKGFTVLAYGVQSGSSVNFTEQGKKYECIVDAFGQCWTTAIASSRGRWKATAALGRHVVSTIFYAPSVHLPIKVQHGSDITVSVSSALPGCSVTAVASGTSYSTTASNTGSATFKIKTRAAGTIIVTLTINGTSFTPQMVQVT
jgi:hypothetical protein